MDLPAIYPGVVFVLSLVITAVWTLDVVKGAQGLRKWADTRAYRNMLLSVVGFVAAAGVFISSWGLIFESAALGVLGLGIARGALLVGGLVLWLAWRR